MVSNAMRRFCTVPKLAHRGGAILSFDAGRYPQLIIVGAMSRIRLDSAQGRVARQDTGVDAC
jgi:hypothetical protein